MENCYLTTIPREAVRGLAGFDPKRPSLSLIRASLIHSEALLSLVFPWIEDWIEKRDVGSVELTICFDSFLQTLKYLRIVFIQDAVCLKEKFPDLFVWNDAFFSTPEFVEFEMQLKRCISEAYRPEDQRIRDVLLDLSARITEEFCSLRSSVSANFAVVESTQKRV